MQYISPLSVLGSDHPDNPDKKAILLAKKKMLAELELNGGHTMVINQQEFSKNDIIKLFDGLQQANDLTYHIAVSKDKVLLRLLEYNVIEKGDKLLNNELYHDDAFIDWVSPFYLNAFTIITGSCFATLDLGVWDTLFRNPLLMNAVSKEKAWDEMEQYFKGDLHQLEYYLENQEVSGNFGTIRNLCDFRYITMMKALPAERFGAFQNEYAFCIMNICVEVFNKKDKSWATNAIQNAALLAESEELRGQIKNKEEEMLHIARSAASGGGSSSSGQSITTWGIVRIALFIIYLLYKFGSGCDGRSNQRNYYQNFPVIRVAPAYKDSSIYNITDSTFDSLMKVIEKDTVLNKQIRPFKNKHPKVNQ